MKSWIEVSERRLTENFRVAAGIARQEAGADLLAVIKANAYGHGAALCAPVLARAGAAWLGVTDAAEGASVREALTHAGVEPERQPRILILCGHLPEDAPAIVRHRLTPVIWTQAQIAGLAGASADQPLPVHIEVDTGMSRQGVSIVNLRSLLTCLAQEKTLKLEGVLTHFASAEIAGADQTASQRAHFAEALRILAEEKARPEWVHAGNTATLDNAADGGTLGWLQALAESIGARPMLREGLGLYGFCLPLAGLAASDGEHTSRLSGLVRPIMTWKTRIVAITEVEPGARIGYNGTFVADQQMRLALLPVGYADGLRRELSCSTECSTWNIRGGWVVIGRTRAAIVGRISMNLTTVDVSGIPEAAVGDEVVLLGEGSTAEDHGAIAGTIPYEILCGMRAAAVLV